MSKRVKLGISMVAALAVPFALAADWATDREAVREAGTAVVTSEAGTTEPQVESITNEIRIYPSF